jgi:hypothetical protein
MSATSLIRAGVTRYFAGAQRPIDLRGHSSDGRRRAGQTIRHHAISGGVDRSHALPPGGPDAVRGRASPAVRAAAHHLAGTEEVASRAIHDSALACGIDAMRRRAAPSMGAAAHHLARAEIEARTAHRGLFRRLLLRWLPFGQIARGRSSRCATHQEQCGQQETEQGRKLPAGPSYAARLHVRVPLMRVLRLSTPA